MIGFDNGPPDGDYVQYIDALMAQRAASLVAATMTPNDDVADRKRSAGGRRNPMTSPAFKSSDERLRDAPPGTSAGASTNADTDTGARVSAAPYASAQSSADASQRAAGLSPTAASAIASVMMVRGGDGRQAPLASTIAIVAGATLILTGILGSTSNVLFIVAGIALISWAIKRLGKAIAPRVEATVADRFATPSMRRTSSRSRDKD